MERYNPLAAGHVDVERVSKIGWVWFATPAGEPFREQIAAWFKDAKYEVVRVGDREGWHWPANLQGFKGAT